MFLVFDVLLDELFCGDFNLVVVCDDLGCLCCIDECWYFIILLCERFIDVVSFDYDIECFMFGWSLGVNVVMCFLVEGSEDL